MKIDAIIPAGGLGYRFSKTKKKQYFKVFGKEILYYTLKHLYNAYNFNKFVIGVLDEDRDRLKEILDSLNIQNYIMSNAGNLRQQTVLNCLKNSDAEIVLIHDAVRPIITREIVKNVITSIDNCDGVICGISLRDAIKEIGEGNTVKSSIDRSKYILVHTPQVFNRELLMLALDIIEKKNRIIYDDAEALEYIGKKIIFVESKFYNIKVTYKEDIQLVKYFMKMYL
jgi:2-C-methyl-D-erythritol 4-phosphate cytidylyltransferase